MAARDAGREAYWGRTPQRRASAPGTHPEDGCRRCAFFSGLLRAYVVTFVTLYWSLLDQPLANRASTAPRPHGDAAGFRLTPGNPQR
jgi:hypothetical protein